MFSKIFALALLLVLAALCARTPPPDPSTSRLPNTCATPAFAAMVAEYDAMTTRRAEVLARIEAIPVEEPAEYVKRWKEEQAALAELSARAEAAGPPRCLIHAKELFVLHLARTQAAVELRAPDRDFSEYRRARETADSIHAQYLSEVKAQEKNRQ